MRRAAAIALFAVALTAAPANAADLHARARLFGNTQVLPDDDVQRAVDGSPTYEGSGDLRLMFDDARGRWRLDAALTTLYEGGDQFAFDSSPQDTLDQTPRNDRLRFADLTWTVEDGPRHETLQRFDRLALQYRAERWGVSVGRDAVSWGGGIVFQPLDIFAPFAPTTVDRDYKPGEDMVKVDGVTDGGSDWQVLGVFRRTANGERTTSVDSFGGKWRGTLRNFEVELLAARHYRDYVTGTSIKHAIGGALLRSDWLVTDLDAGGYKISGTVNLDYSFTWQGRSWYVFGEYFHSGFGTNGQPPALNRLPVALRDRLLRGELFTLMQDSRRSGRGSSGIRSSRRR